MKRALSQLLVVVLLRTSATSVFAATSYEEDLKADVVDYMVAVNAQIGYFMSDEELLVLAD